MGEGSGRGRRGNTPPSRLCLLALRRSHGVFVRVLFRSWRPDQFGLRKGERPGFRQGASHLKERGMPIRKKKDALPAIPADKRFGAPFGAAVIVFFRLDGEGPVFVEQSLLQQHDGARRLGDLIEFRPLLLIAFVVPLELGVERDRKKRREKLLFVRIICSGQKRRILEGVKSGWGSEEIA